MSADSTTSAARPRGLLRAIYFVVCNTLLLLLVAELGCRAHSSLTTDAPAAPEESVRYALHPFLQTVNPPGERIDPGPHMAGWDIEPRGTTLDMTRRRILFLGGSTSMNEYPRYVRQALEAAVGPTTSYNLAFSWYTSLHSLYQFWTYADEVEPDLVVVLHNVNDFYRGFTSPRTSLPQYRADYSHSSGGLNFFWSVGKSAYDGSPLFYARPGLEYVDRYEPPDGRLGGLWSEFLDSSAVARAIRAKLAPPRARPEFVTVDMADDEVLRALPAFVRNMQNLRLSCAEKNVPVLFLTMPFSVDAPIRAFLPPSDFMTNDGVHHLSPEDFVFGMKRFNEAVVALRAEPLSHVIDVAATIVDPKLFQDEVHLVDEGLRQEARLVAEYILERKLLPSR